MDILKDALSVNIEAFKKTIKSLVNLPLFALIIYFLFFLRNLIFVALSGLMQGNSYFMGFTHYLLNIAILSVLIKCLDIIISGSRLRLSSVFSGWSEFINPLLSTYFIVYLIEFVAVRILGTSLNRAGGLGPSISQLIEVLIMVFKSPLLEMIYIGGQAGMSNISESFYFIKDNIATWVIINIPFIYLTRQIQLSSYFMFGAKTALVVMGLSILLAVVLIYKGYLFERLNSSNIRKRKFEGMF